MVQEERGNHDRGDKCACISEELVLRLCRIGLLLEAEFGHPCDIEWAETGGLIYLLQVGIVLEPFIFQHSLMSRVSPLVCVILMYLSNVNPNIIRDKILYRFAQMSSIFNNNG